MDFGTIKGRIMSMAYPSALSFATDVDTIIRNCLAFNPPLSPWYALAVTIHRVFKEQVTAEALRAAGGIKESDQAAAAALTATGRLRPAAWAACIVGVTITAALVAIAHVPADGIRGILPLGILSILHTMLAVRSGPRPLRDEDAVPVETATAPAGS